MPQIKPLSDRVVVQPTPREETTRGGIVLPDTAKEKPQEGKVVAVGPGRVTDEGKTIAPELKEGDAVLYAKYAGTEVRLDETDYLILSERDILA
ncbi:MAG TPA: co-chaperone GroES, partial [Chloroflexota bacterium]|nr:co-chaperone GroES [Chloroflexota bacterium]